MDDSYFVLFPFNSFSQVQSFTFKSWVWHDKIIREQFTQPGSVLLLRAVLEQCARRARRTYWGRILLHDGIKRNAVKGIMVPFDDNALIYVLLSIVLDLYSRLLLWRNEAGILA